MLIDRNIKNYTLSSEESVISALQKMCQTGSRMMLLISQSGVLEGVFTDGDLRHWLAANSDANLNEPVIRAANQKYVFARANLPPEQILGLFKPKVQFIPLVDMNGRLVGVARPDDVTVSIADYKLGDTSPAFVIAEIGNNHNGNLELAKELVDHAVAAGANCAKFQMRNMSSLFRTTRSQDGADEDLGVQYVLDLLNRFQLTDEQLFDVFAYCEERGILPMCTPWDLASVKSLQSQGLAAYKIASADLTNHELLEAVANTGKTTILSTGMSDESEILEACSLLKGKGTPFILLHCNSTYPAPFSDLNLRYLDRLRQMSGGVVGYSGHERGYHAVLAAVAMGARVIEKHITVDRSMEGNDHKVSLLPEEFRAMVEAIREVEAALGTGAERRLSQGETINRSTLAKSLVAARHIKAGEELSSDMILARSPGRGLQPNRKSQLVGRTAKRDLEPGDFFFASDLLDENLQPRDYSFKRCWGVPVRYHDFQRILSRTNTQLLEFHLSYKDLDLDASGYFNAPFPDIDLVVHSPELFAGDHILDLCSADETYRQHSVKELQRVIDLTRFLKQFFPKTSYPLIVTNVGGFSLDRPLSKAQVANRMESLGESLRSLDREGIEIIPQTMPPYPWHMGGQRFHNLFVDSGNIVDICESLKLRVCFDVSHSQLACNQLKHSFKQFVDAVGPLTAHLHIADARGVDGEGLQVGEGDMDFPALASGLARTCPSASFIPEVWQGHINEGEGFWLALSRLEGVI